MKNIIANNINVKALTLSLVHLIISFYTDRFIFIGSPSNHLVHFIICKILLLVLLYHFWSSIISRRVMSFNKIANIIPFIVIFVLALLMRSMESWNAGDCQLMYEHAIQYDPWPQIFTYIQGYLYIISYMLIPSKYAVLIIETLIYSFILGYVLERLKRVLSNKYLPYLYVVIAIPLLLTTLPLIPHRLPIYTPFYVLFLSIVYFDYLDHKQIKSTRLFYLALLVSVLSHWRVEGFYLALLYPIIIYLAYANLRGKTWLKSLVIFFITLIAVGVPQYLSTMGNDSEYISRRSSPIYTWTVATMMLNGLDEEKNTEDLQLVDRYMSLDTVRKMNREMGEDSYQDEHIRFTYNGINENLTQPEFEAFIKSSQNIIKNNLPIFVKSRINAFKYMTRIELWGNRWLNLLINIYIPLTACFLLLVYGLFTKKWIYLFMASAPISHFFITLLLLPAAYFKYFYIQFFVGWQILVIAVLLIINRYLLKTSRK